MTDKLLVANGWRMVVVANADGNEIRFHVGHPEVEHRANIAFPIKDLVNGIVLDVNALMNIAMDIVPVQTTKRDG